jgi:hypothetical protein
LAFETYLKARVLADNHVLDALDERLIQCIAQDIKTETLESLLFREMRKDIRAILNLARAYDSFKRGDSYDTRITLNVVWLEDLPGIYHSLYFQLDRHYSLDKKLKNIGVILPLSGDNHLDGKSYLAGLFNAFNDIPLMTNLSLFIFDNENDCAKTVSLVRLLRNTQKINGILGPLSDENAKCGASTSSDGIPILLPNTRIPHLSEISPVVFQLNTDYEYRGRSMAHQLVEDLDFQKIAILSPSDDNAIRRETEYFIDELNQMGIEPVAIEWYAGIPEKLSPQFKSIRKVAWTLLEPDSSDMGSIGTSLEIDSLDALFDVDVSDFFEMPEPEPEKTMSKRDSSKVVLSSIDALYLPIKENHLKYVGTQFPIYNLNCTVIGNSEWIHPDIKKETIGPHLNGMLVYTNKFYENSWDIYEESEEFDRELMQLGQDHGEFLISMGRQLRASRKSLTENMKRRGSFQGKVSRLKFGGNEQNMNTAFEIIKYSDQEFSPKSIPAKLNQ